MKTCKGFFGNDSEWFPAVPLSEFEAYKAKTKQAIENLKVRCVCASKPHPNDFLTGYNKAFRDLEKELGFKHV